MAERTVLYFFAFPSPFAALADARIDDLVAGAGAVLEPIPIVPPVLGSPPEGLAATVAEFKRSYQEEDAARQAKRLGLAWNPPPAAPTPPDSTDAVAGWYFALARGAERAYRNAVFRARFAEAGDITDRELLAGCAAAAGLDRQEFADALEAGRHHEEVPKGLAAALENRVFGVPMFVLDGERFWGNDRIEYLMEALGQR